VEALVEQGAVEVGELGLVVVAEAEAVVAAQEVLALGRFIDE
jgi:hypothetical protein